MITMNQKIMEYETAYKYHVLHFIVTCKLNVRAIYGRYLLISNKYSKSIIIINTHERFAIAFLPLTTRLSTELFEARNVE